MGSVEKGLIGQGSHNHSASHKSKCSPTPPCAFKHVLAINTSLGSGKTSFPHSTVCWMERVKLLPTTYLFGIAAAPNVSWIVIQYLTSTVTDLSSRQWILRIHDDPTRFEGRKTVLGARFMSLSVCVHVCIHIYIYIHMYGIQYNIHYSYVSSPEDHWIKIIEQRSLLSIPKLLPSSWVT